MRLAPAHDSTDSALVGRSNQFPGSVVRRPGKLVAENPGLRDDEADPDLVQRYEFPRTFGPQVLLHVLAVCSGLALLVIAVLPVVSD